MDEILIEEKKYVSSKQAAKMTGYAKDYIGQLCREGRVPARLVGRSWYVLESAIQDHRFGGQDVEAQPVAQPEPAMSLTHMWESTRYEASHTETLPSLNRLEREETGPESPEGASPEEAAELSNLHDSWRAWFDHVAEAETIQIEPAKTPEPIEKKEEESSPMPMPAPEEEEVRIPLHVVAEKRSLREIFPIEKRESAQAEPVVALQEEKRGRNSLLNASYALGAIATVASIVVASIGSGYFDWYFISTNQDSVISGITVVNK